MSLWGAADHDDAVVRIARAVPDSGAAGDRLTVGLGTALSFLLAPLTLALMRSEWKEKSARDLRKRETGKPGTGNGKRERRIERLWAFPVSRFPFPVSRFPPFSALGALLALACVHHETAPPPRGPAPPTAAELPPPDAIPGVFTLRQKLTATSPKGGGSFEAVLQKQPGTLTLVGLTPYGSRAFLLQQTKGDVQFTKYIPRELPFAPTFLLLDIHRALATWIGPPLPAGERSAQVGDETVRERWQDGKLVERTFVSAKANPPGRSRSAIAAQSAPGAASIATHITLKNARMDYRVDIETVPPVDLVL
jgi:hypothetical protein